VYVRDLPDCFVVDRRWTVLRRRIGAGPTGLLSLCIVHAHTLDHILRFILLITSLSAKELDHPDTQTIRRHLDKCKF
jgi:hypothetical protein